MKNWKLEIGSWN